MHRTLAAILASVSVLLASWAAVPVALGEEPVPQFGLEGSPIRTRADLEDVIARLDDEETRLEALEVLVEFASIRVYQVGSMFGGYADPEMNKLLERATRVARRQDDLETVEQALKSESENLQYWALWHMPNQPDDEPDDDGVVVERDRIAPWRHLLPRVRELASKGNASLRGLAQHRLEDAPDQKEFLARLMETETSASNIMRRLYGSNGKGLSDRLDPHLRRLLHHEDAEVRRSALGFVGSNSGRAKMWQFEFSDAVFARVMVLTRSGEPKERASAVYALTDLRARDPAAVRERAIELANDMADDVRWRVPALLADELDHPEAQAVLARLLRDDSPAVRYFTILKLGPEKHVKELRELAAGPDAQYADWAEKKLRQIGAAP